MKRTELTFAAVVLTTLLVSFLGMEAWYVFKGYTIEQAIALVGRHFGILCVMVLTAVLGVVCARVVYACAVRLVKRISQ
jgi:hypothetical protein